MLELYLFKFTPQLLAFLSNKKEIFAVFLDINSAFPNVNCDILFNKNIVTKNLYELGLELSPKKTVCLFTKNYFF